MAATAQIWLGPVLKHVFTGHIIIILMAGMAVMAGYFIEERRRWPVITASPRRQCSKSIQNLEGKACSDEKTVPVTEGQSSSNY